MAEYRLRTSEGRTLCVLERGLPNGRPILVQGGSPNSRLLFEPHVQLAERQGIRLISYDRPGCGESSPRPGRTVADCAEDVRHIAEALGLERLGVWGISAGAPHALACAALLPDLVAAAVTLGCPAPWGAPGLDYFDGMAEDNVEEIRLIIENPEAARAMYEENRVQMLQATPQALLEFMKPLLSPPDAAVFTGDFAQFLVNFYGTALAPGAQGWWDDDVAWLQRWGFELGSIRTPVLVMHGRQDTFVPFGHGEWLARQIPDAHAKLTDEDGHLTLTENHLAEIHAWLLERLDNPKQVSETS